MTLRLFLRRSAGDGVSEADWRKFQTKPFSIFALKGQRETAQIP